MKPTTKEINARKLRPEDTAVAFEVLRAVKASELPRTFNAEHVCAYLSRPQNVLIAGTCDGAPAGFLLAYLLDRVDGDRPMVCLYELGVAEPFRRRGVARTMLEMLIELGRQMEARKVWTIADRANRPAVALYERTGAMPQGNGEQVTFVWPAGPWKADRYA